MNAVSTEEVRARLLQQKAELAERVSKIKADVTGGLEADSKEQAAQLENQEVLDALANEATAELELISAALLRLDEGTYGICVVSEKPIPKERLRAIPWAAERVEYKAGGFGLR